MKRDPIMEEMRAQVTPEMKAEFDKKFNEAYPEQLDEKLAECDLYGHGFMPEMGFDNVITDYVCIGCGKRESEV